MSKITIIHDDETGVMEIDGSDGELSQLEILGVLTMAINIIVQTDVRPISRDEQVKIEIANKQQTKKRYDA